MTQMAGILIGATSQKMNLVDLTLVKAVFEKQIGRNQIGVALVKKSSIKVLRVHLNPINSEGIKSKTSPNRG